MKRHIPALLTASLVLVAGCAGDPGDQYEKGYHFGRGLPATHLGNPVNASSTYDGAASSECGEHAETDGVKITEDWMAGCVDGALGRPASPPASG
ncbi:hypothetical protein ACWDSD_12915 [Streptomyces spiralis]|uniref:hypothetical protein n=1 Tax=Streptomyces sp. NRRL S-813 TaxID=1463919 RepID=UPI0004C08149|nr:hypothetical protein [Streptomyces sp. NRRL S-813]